MLCLGFSELKPGGGRLTAKVLCLGFTEFEEGYCKIWHSKQKAYIIALQNCVISIVSVFNFNKSEPATDKYLSQLEQFMEATMESNHK